ncbi:MAG TPA: hypothetical protein VHC69_15210 [Polyangiaceae bacterium]|nr:hypothetical protein [Polyangiaceae bacterium]
MTELDRDARRLLSLAREARTPSNDDKARVGRRLAGALLLGATSAHAGSAGSTKVVAGALSAKWGAIALLVVAGGAGYAGLRASHATTAPPRNTAPPAQTAVAAAPIAEAAPISAVEPGAPEMAPVPAHATGTDGVARAELPAPKSAPQSTLSQELDLLHDAQAKWRAGDASAALALLAEHRRRFPRSVLAPERDALTVLSLCATNRTAEAKRLARHFLQQARHSPLRTTVEESCGGK